MVARVRSRALFGAALAAVMPSGAKAQSQAQAAPVQKVELEQMVGRWVGGGRMRMNDGTEVALKCLFVHARSGSALNSDLRCSTSTNDWSARSSLSFASANATGDWQELKYGLSGSSAGRIVGNAISFRVSSLFVTADVRFQFQDACRKLVTLKPLANAAGVAALSVSMRKC